MNRIKRRNVLLVIMVIFIGILLSCFVNTRNAIEVPAASRLTITGTLEAYTLEDLTIESHAVVYGEVSGQSAPFIVEPGTGSDPLIYTDYYIKPTSVLRGNIAENDEITIRLTGGTIDNFTVEVKSGPELKVGKKYMLFLYKPSMGLGYHTLDDDYYCITGSTQGVYDMVDKYYFESQVTSLEPIQLENFEQTLLRQNRMNPVNENNMREKALQGLNENLASGFISQEEFDRAIEMMDIYGTIEE